MILFLYLDISMAHNCSASIALDLEYYTLANRTKAGQLESMAVWRVVYGGRYIHLCTNGRGVPHCPNSFIRNIGKLGPAWASEQMTKNLH